MTRWLRIAAATLGGIALGGLAAFWIAQRRWRLETDRLAEQIEPVQAPPAPRRVSFASLGSLPPPVERYFRTVLRDGQPYVHSVRTEQAGYFNMKIDGNEWKPYDAIQFYNVGPPGYVWDARIHLAPLLDVRVRDAYAREHGSMRGALLAAIGVVNEHGRPELDEGSLLRYLAEAPIFPTALLPECGVAWMPIDADHAEASITDGSTTAHLTFAFAPSGEIVTVSTPRRYRAEKGGYVPASWGGRYRGVEVRDGMRVPAAAEVWWNDGGGERSYVTQRISRATYHFAP